ncbi:MAG TPA: hypothetical protein VFQ20_01370 [Burkholderiaceae bacterium]|nr:hypothetical protein [Burkholderiaceae bacterium]
MAERDLVAKLIAAPGQTQADRDAAALDPARAPLHVHDAAALLAQAPHIGARIRFDDGKGTPDLDWRGFYPLADAQAARALLARRDGGVTPHLALAAAFAHLFDAHPRRLANTFAARHLDAQWRDALGFVKRAAVPDRAHLVVELKKGITASTALDAKDVFLAGKDAAGAMRHYRPVRETFVGPARVVSLRALHRDADGRISAAPIADSADGQGAPLATLAPALPAWGALAPRPGSAWPAADIGFAIAAPLLALAEGRREIELVVTLDDALPASLRPRLASTFEAVYSAPDGWSAARPVIADALGPNQLRLALTLASDAPAVVGCDAALHGPAFATRAPVVQWRLRDAASMNGLDGLTVASVALAVSVQGMTKSLQLENDAGALDPKRAFQPFGAAPTPGARFSIGCEEALSKPVADLKIHLAWQAAPTDLEGYYAGYSRQTKMRNGVTATLAFTDGRGRSTRRALDLMARNADGVSVLAPDAPPPGPEPWGFGDLLMLDVVWRGNVKGGFKRRFGGASENRNVAGAPLAAKPGFIHVQLVDDFLHADHRREVVTNALKKPPVVLGEPYTPVVASIALDYRATSGVVPMAPGADEAADAANLAAAPLQWFHVGAFGARREHAFLRRQQAFVGPPRVPLLPDQRAAGELLIGVASASAGDPLSLLVQVAEGSADPELAPPALAWSVLAGDQWKPLGADEIGLDTTRGLLQSGLVSIALPRETTSAHHWLPDGLVWLRVAAPANPRATCLLLSLAANGIEVAYDARPGNDERNPATPLDANRIAKLERPRAEIKSIAQPYPSFGGRRAEDDASLRRRAAERLRHRGRALSAWDIERLVLEAFPQLHQAKCIAHAAPGRWLAPGQTTLVVVPRLGGAAAGADPLAPRVDLGTLEAIREFVQARAAMGIGLTVKNAFFEPLRLSCALRLKPGQAFNAQRARLNDRIVAALTPWAFDATQRIAFGGRVFRSTMLALIEGDAAVDFVTDLRLQRVNADGSLAPDAAEVGASRPDAILVSASAHSITEVV